MTRQHRPPVPKLRNNSRSFTRKRDLLRNKKGTALWSASNFVLAFAGPSGSVIEMIQSLVLAAVENIGPVVALIGLI